MSEVLQQIATVELEKLATGIADNFLGGMRDLLEEAEGHAREKVEEVLKEAARFKHKALTAKNQEEARLYAGEAETAVRRVKTILLAEKLVAEESIASMIANFFSSALDTLGDAITGLLGTLASAAAKGVIQGLVGEEGEGSDLSGIFPFAK